MWDRPDILNRISGLLYTLAALLTAYGALYFVVHLPLFPIREVRVDGRIEHVTPDQVKALVGRGLRGNFFTLDIVAIRATFERLPWVRKANVRRHWPGRLDVTLEEHEPLARWGNLGLVDTYGEVFEAAYDGALPVFLGPAGSAKEIAIQYEYFRRSLAAIGKVPAVVQVSPRRAWQIRLAEGPTLELGREQIEARLSRFIAAYGRTVGRLGQRVDYVDLRYPNGFAVRIPGLRFEPSQQKGRGAARG